MITENISLKPYNTFGIDAMARAFATFASVEELEEIMKAASVYENRMILGGGSNILLTKDVDGLVLKNEVKGI